MLIPFDIIAQIVKANDIVDVISSYLRLRKNGKNYLAVCPFHPDKNPSMSISPEKQVYHCFSCKASGNVFTFVQNFEKIPFTEAAVKLAERAGIKINFSNGITAGSNKSSILFEINKEAAKYFHKNLISVKNAEGEVVNSFLKSREINKQTIVRFGLGYSNNSWDSLLTYFREEHSFKESDIADAGLLKEREDGTYYDTFRGRLIFPILNESSKVVGFGARKLFDDDAIMGKFINTKETLIYNKSRVLFGLNFAKESIREKDYVIIVEGYMDMISLFMNGTQNVIATCGTALTADHLKLISRFSKNIILIFDSDEAGQKAAKSGLQLILQAGLEVGIVVLPDGEDPDSYVRKFGNKEFEGLITEKLSLISFLASVYKKKNLLNTAAEKTAFIREIMSYISLIRDKIKRSFLIKEIAQEYGLSEADLFDELSFLIRTNKSSGIQRDEANRRKSAIAPAQKESEGIIREEKELIRLLLNSNEDVIAYIENNLEFDLIQSPVIKDLVHLLLEEFMNEGKIDLAKIINQVQIPEIVNMLTQLVTNKYSTSEISEKDNDSLLYYVSKKGIDYLKYSVDLIKKLKIRKIESEIKGIPKTEENLPQIIRLKQEILIIKNSKEE